MEMYNVSEHGNTETYLIQGAESNSQLTTPLPEQIEAMYNEGAPEFVVDQGLYYPTATNYGYYCTGFESPGEWEDHHRVFGVDGPDVQYTGVQNESSPYVYYPPSYGYAQSPYNPYNPYIPGAMIGVESPFVGAQQYYAIPPYQNPASSPAYVPYVIQPDIVPGTSADSLYDAGVSMNRPDGRGLKQNLSSATGAFPRNSLKSVPNQTNSMARVSEGSRTNTGPSKQSVMHGSVSAGSFTSPVSSHVVQGRSASGSIPAVDNFSNVKVISQQNQMKVTRPASNGLSGFGPSAYVQTGAKIRPKIHVGRALNDVIGSTDALGEQNRGPRINRSKDQLAVKAYTTRSGDGNAEVSITMSADQYNKDEFPVDYADAKFFVIKSYSEDDVHKSIKYNVWSSTPHGNKKLGSAYEDAQRMATEKHRSCPIFLFFSVNASGQFCGVAEMVGPVDFNKDMDFWQQDKWSGSFPLKWHIIKDVPNTNLRHIILENNENKPVTNSRDTQEVLYKKGLEMLKIFKNFTLKSSILDDFSYYENRQKLMQEEKARLLVKNYGSPYLVPALDPPRKLNSTVELPPSEDEKTKHSNGPCSSIKTGVSASEQSSISDDVTNSIITDGDAKQIAVQAKEDLVSTLQIGSLTINPKEAEAKPLPAAGVANTESVDVVTVGSVSIKVNGFAESGFLTVGTIPLDPRALHLDKGGASVNNGSQRQ